MNPARTPRAIARHELRRRARRLHRRAVFPILCRLWPADCFACGRPLGAAHLMGACTDCWSELRPIRPPCCPSCGIPRPDGTDLLGPSGGRCAPCVVRDASILGGVRAAVLYDARARRFVLRAKFGARPELLGVLGEQLARLVRATGFAATATVVAPVPSHPWVELRRGFNPALEIARPVARRLGLPLARGLVVRRLRHPAAAKRLRAAARRRRLARAFRARRAIPGERVLLIDDVLTTGATAEGCALTLRRAGAHEVRVAVWARTPPSGGMGV